MTNEYIAKMLSFLIFRIVWLLNFTYRFRYDGTGVLTNSKNKNYILAIWHQNLFGGILAQTGRPYIVIISRSKDADSVAYTCQKLGHITVRGSSKKKNVDKGGKLAKDEMIEFLKKGIPGAVTVDGPKGPAFSVKPGIIDMAKKANVVIVPYGISLSSYWEFKSWDKFRLPKPFCKILISYGGPIDVSDESIDFTLHQQTLENALKKQTLEADIKLAQWDSYPQVNELTKQ